MIPWPYPGGPETTANGLLLFSALFAVTYGLMLERPAHWRRTAAKLASVLLLVVIAVERGGPGLLIAALVLSAAGDAFLAYRGERAFLGGLASFLAAHLAFVALFATADSGAMLPLAVAVGVIAAMAAFVAVMGWLIVPAAGRALRLPVVAYMAAILAMGVAAALNADLVVLAGAILFIASDAALGAGRFVIAADHRLLPAVHLFVWGAYWLAQATILIGMTG